MRSVLGQNRERWRDRGLAALFTAALWLTLSIWFDFYYDLNDDTAMKDILSGAYTGIPDGHNIQMLYPLSWLISRLYRLLPALPWYGFFLCGCQFLALWLIGCVLAGRIRQRERKAAALLLLTAGAGILFLYEYVFIQYTVTAGLLAAAALFRLYGGPDMKEGGALAYHAATAALIALSFYLRTELLLLVCPFLGLAWLLRAYRGIREGKAVKGGKDGQIRSVCAYVLLPAFALLFMGLGLLADRAAYGSPAWRSFRQFFDDRTAVYDFYGLPSYEGNEGFYQEAGLSQAEYALLENYDFDLDEKIDTERMHKIALYAAQSRRPGAGRRLYLSLYTYVYRFTHGEELLFDLLLVFAYFFLAKAALSSGERGLLMRLALLFGIRTALWLFLLYRGRAPERVTHPLYLMELSMLLLFFLYDTGTIQWKKYEKSAILFLYVLFFACAAISHIGTVRQSYADREETNADWRDFQAYCRKREGAFYLVDVYSSVAYSEKLFSDFSPAYRNFDLAGGWCVKSPIAQEKRRKAGFESVEAALADGEVYFVTDHTKRERSADFLIPYYAEKGRRIVLQEIDRCGKFSVIRLKETETAD